MKLHHIALTATAALLAACATTTPYQEASQPGGYDGYSQTVLENDRARVTFGGNSLTKRETVENYLLYRAAELTLEKGYDHFTLIERDTEEKTRLTGTSSFSNFYDPYFGYSFYRPRYGWSHGYRFSRFGGFHGSRFGYRGFGRAGFRGYGYDPFFNDFHVREITKYRATAEVLFGRGSKPNGKENAFNAREVIDNLGSSIVYPENTGSRPADTPDETTKT